ncbi:MAG: protein jag [Oscillospiraceae bacterium]|nr:protein jag [Oscillospiraceae bacterium]
MLKSMEFRAKTVEDAVARALAELGLKRDDVSVEIVERGKSGFLGILAADAVIRVSYESQEEEAADAAAPAEPGKPAEPAEAPAPAKKESPAPAPAAPAGKPRTAEGAQAEQTESFLTGLLEHMGVKADIAITPRKGGGLDVDLSGSGIGAVIGRRGETLDAIQHLTNYVVNRGSDKRAHINVDAENYRAKREESLVRLAEKMAAKAVKYKRSMALEPMNSYERHVIHAALQEYEGVTTSSTGAEPNRRVVVSYVPAETKKANDDYKEWC